MVAHFIFSIFCIFYSAEMAHRSSFKVEEGDILLLGTDGLFDNLHEDMIVDFIAKYKVGILDLEIAFTSYLPLNF